MFLPGMSLTILFWNEEITFCQVQFKWASATEAGLYTKEITEVEQIQQIKNLGNRKYGFSGAERQWQTETCVRGGRALSPVFIAAGVLC